MFRPEDLQLLASFIVADSHIMPPTIFARGPLTVQNPNLPQEVKSKLVDINTARFSEEKGHLLIDASSTVGVSLLTLTIKHCPRFVLELLDKLAEHKIRVHRIGSDTPTLYAIKCWRDEVNHEKAKLRLDVIRKLATLGANLIIPNSETGETPLAVAVRGGHSEIVNILTCHKRVRDTLEQVTNGRTLLLEAAATPPSQDQSAIMYYLLEAGADTTARDASTGNTALFMGIISQKPALVTALLGYNPERQLAIANLDGISPLWIAIDIAARTGTDISLGIVRALVEAGANLGEERENETPIAFAVRTQNIKLVEILALFDGTQPSIDQALELANKILSEVDSPAKHAVANKIVEILKHTVDQAILTALANLEVTIGYAEERNLPNKNLFLGHDKLQELAKDIAGVARNLSPSQLIETVSGVAKLGLHSDNLNTALTAALTRNLAHMTQPQVFAMVECILHLGLRDAALSASLAAIFTASMPSFNRAQLPFVAIRIADLGLQNPELGSALIGAFITHLPTMIPSQFALAMSSIAMLRLQNTLLNESLTALFTKNVANMTPSERTDAYLVAEQLGLEVESPVQPPAKRARKAADTCAPGSAPSSRDPEDPDSGGSSKGRTTITTLGDTQPLGSESAESREVGRAGNGGTGGKQAVLKLSTNPTGKEFNAEFTMWAATISYFKEKLGLKNTDNLLESLEKRASESLDKLIFVEGKGNVMPLLYPGYPDPNGGDGNEGSGEGKLPIDSGSGAVLIYNGTESPQPLGETGGTLVAAAA